MIPLDGRVVRGRGHGEPVLHHRRVHARGQARPAATSTPGPWWRRASASSRVEKASGGGRYDRIVRMIEESEKLKSTAEDQASRLADRLVPYTLGGTALTYLLTRNVTKTLSVLMVDFSCALKLAIPIAVLSAMRESSELPHLRQGRALLGGRGPGGHHRVRQDRHPDLCHPHGGGGRPLRRTR